ncbi:hypothetical protein AYI68_g1041 [Smittium mucronatum]|uniref:Uncharacterized protein n=1 Tax=Smittium mucronatum TaxID=133383 RepID=A0A1R0H6L8_9FUNG|nr:hypothetical protein AYI68_g1041 [Smittium mucronatum]
MPKFWNKNFSEFSNDSTGNRRRTTKWESVITICCEYFLECDANIKCFDITMVLIDTSYNKAPVSDGIPSESKNKPDFEILRSAPLKRPP